MHAKYLDTIRMGSERKIYLMKMYPFGPPSFTYWTLLI